MTKQATVIIMPIMKPALKLSVRILPDVLRSELQDEQTSIQKGDFAMKTEDDR